MTLRNWEKGDRHHCRNGHRVLRTGLSPLPSANLRRLRRHSRRPLGGAGGAGGGDGRRGAAASGPLEHARLLAAIFQPHQHPSRAVWRRLPDEEAVRHFLESHGDTLPGVRSTACTAEGAPKSSLPNRAGSTRPDNGWPRCESCLAASPPGRLPGRPAGTISPPGPDRGPGAVGGGYLPAGVEGAVSPVATPVARAARHAAVGLSRPAGADGCLRPAGGHAAVDADRPAVPALWTLAPL